MATLHNVTENTKLLLKWGGILLFVIILLVFVYRGGLFLKEMFFPTPVIAPTVAFGKLPVTTFPQSEMSKNYSFVIDTVSGRLPVFLDDEKKPRDRMKVYQIRHNELTLLDLQNTKNQVARVGFGGPGVNISDTIYRFQKIEDLPKTLDIDIVDKNFTITSAYTINPRVVNAENIPNPTRIVEETTTFLRDLGTFPADIDTKKTKTQLLALKNGELEEVDRLSDAQIVRVDYFQKNLETFPIYYPQGVYSTMNFLVTAGSRTLSDIVLGNYYHQSIMTPTRATYPIKPVATAYQELLDGKGYVAADFTQSNEVRIKDVLLGYYAPDETQGYLMPIYVFKGKEDEFYAYVWAIDPTWITSTATSEPSPAE